MQTMQLAPDGKMYVARNGGAYLAVVNDPDSVGLACNFTDDGFSMSGGFSSYGLPNFPEQLFTSAPPVLQNQFAASDSFVCEKFCVDFQDLSTTNPLTWFWEFPGGIPSTSTNQDPANICYDNPGTYDVTLITSNASGSDTITLPGFITVYDTPPFPVITQDDSVLTSSPAAAYQWQFNSIDIPGATNQSYTITGTGFYTVVIIDSNSCQNSTTIYIEVTGLEEVPGDNAEFVFVYPNPSNGNFILEGQQEGATNLAGMVSIKVLNDLGQEVYYAEENVNGIAWKKEIELEKKIPGVYLLQLFSEHAPGALPNLLFSGKIIVMK
jgi:hypothetical protein